MAVAGAGVGAPLPDLREDYEVDKPELEITVKLKHPGDSTRCTTTTRRTRSRSEALARTWRHKNSFAGDDSGSRVAYNRAAMD